MSDTNDTNRRLTKEDRERYRRLLDDAKHFDPDYPALDDADIMKLLDDLDTADDEAEALRTRLRATGEEIAHLHDLSDYNSRAYDALVDEADKLRILLRDTVSRVIDGDDMPWERLIEARIIDEAGDPIYDEEDDEDDEKPQTTKKPRIDGGDAS